MTPALANPQRVVKRVIDVSLEREERDFGTAGWHRPELRALVAYHVTDDPSAIERTLLSGRRLVASHRGVWQDLGPGLYVSGAPDYWMSRGRSKWQFMDRLTSPQRLDLAHAILSHPHMSERGYISASERENAERIVYEFLDHGNNAALVLLSDQPYNVRFWKLEFLEPLGIEPSRQPQAVEVHLRGRFAEVTTRFGADTRRRLERVGVDGAFLKGGWGSDPQMVVWTNRAVIRFGNVERIPAPGSIRA